MEGMCGHGSMTQKTMLGFKAMTILVCCIWTSIRGVSAYKVGQVFVYESVPCCE